MEKGLEEEEEEGKPECFVIVLVISVTLGWYLLHLFVTRTYPSLLCDLHSFASHASHVQPHASDLVCGACARNTAVKVLARAKRVRDLLNPITSGVMVL